MGSQKKKRQHRGRGEAVDRGFIEEFSKCLGQVLNRHPLKPTMTRIELLRTTVQSKVLYGFLRNPIDIERIKPFVEHSKDCKRRFLNGFFDSEVSVISDGSIPCFNSDQQFLNYTKRPLSDLGIKTTGLHLRAKKGTPIHDKRKGKPYRLRKNIYSLYISARSRQKFYELEGFTMIRKKAKTRKPPKK
ncbi:MAG: LAGLIDADG family homing endonuclease [Nitrososphaerota archaeon]